MASPAQRAISLLIDMADQGDINPWDVNVIDVVDRFLEELRLDDLSAYFTTGQSTLGHSRYEADLSESGQAFLYASMLVLLKADTLAQEEEPVPEVLDEFEDESDDIIDTAAALPRHLERQLRRRAVARPPQKRQVTLAELIEQLELMALALETPRSHRPQNRARAMGKRQAIRSISQLAHKENLGEMAESLGVFVADRWKDLPSLGQGWVDFDDLVEVWHRSPLNTFSDRPDRIGVFWAMLFLSAQGKVELAQKDFYQGLQLRQWVAEGVARQPQEQTITASAS